MSSVGTAGEKPIAFAYARVLERHSDEFRLYVEMLAAAADAGGYTLAGVFTDERDELTHFQAMLGALARIRPNAVFVPTIDHLPDMLGRDRKIISRALGVVLQEVLAAREPRHRA